MGGLKSVRREAHSGLNRLEHIIVWMQLAASRAERSLRQKKNAQTLVPQVGFDLRFACQKGVKTETPFKNGNCG